MGMRGGNREEGSDQGAQKRHFGGGWNKRCTFYLWLDRSLFLNALCSQQNGKIINLWEKTHHSFECGLVNRDRTVVDSGGCCLVSIQSQGDQNAGISEGAHCIRCLRVTGWGWLVCDHWCWSQWTAGAPESLSMLMVSRAGMTLSGH